MCQAVTTVLIADSSLLIHPFGGSDYRVILPSNHSCGSQKKEPGLIALKRYGVLELSSHSSERVL